MTPARLALLSAAMLVVASTHAGAQTESLVPAAIPPQFEPGTAAVPPRVCPEGRTASGACVNPVASIWARRTGMVVTQGRTSASAGPPALATYDPYYRYPNAVLNDTKRDLDLQFGRRSSSYVPQPYHPFGGPGTPFPTPYPIN